MIQQPSPLTRLISGTETLILDATLGTETLGNAKDVFLSGIDPDLKRLQNKVISKPETKVVVREIVKNVILRHAFNSIDDLNKLCFTQQQIINFCRKYPNLLRQNGFANFFLFDDAEFYNRPITSESTIMIACVYVDRGGLFASFAGMIEGNDYFCLGVCLHRIIVHI